MKAEIIYETVIHSSEKLTIQKDGLVIELDADEVKELHAVVRGDRNNLCFFRNKSEYSPYKVISFTGGKSNLITYDDTNSDSED